MAGTFPNLTSGKLAFNGTELSLGRRTQVKIAVNFSEQRWKTSQPLFSGVLSGAGISAYDLGRWKEFFDSQKGEKDTGWTLVVEDPPGTTNTYDNMTFDQDVFSKTETRHNKFNCSLKVRQIRKT